jgi:hypothetical protein
VNCRDTDNVISSRSGDSVFEQQLAEHLIHGERCRGLAGLLDKADDGLRPSENLLRRIKAGILKDLKPIRPLAASNILFFGCAIIFLSVVAVGALLLGMNGWGALSVVQRIVVFVSLAGSAVLLGIYPTVAQTEGILELLALLGERFRLGPSQTTLRPAVNGGDTCAVSAR